MVIGPGEQKREIRLRKMDDFEIYINAVYIDYDSDDFISTGFVCQSNTTEPYKVSRSK